MTTFPIPGFAARLDFPLAAIATVLAIKLLRLKPDLLSTTAILALATAVFQPQTTPLTIVSALVLLAIPISAPSSKIVLINTYKQSSDSPLEKAILYTKTLKNFNLPANEIRILTVLILECLNCQDITVPLSLGMENGGCIIEDEENQWVFNELASRKSSISRNANSRDEPLIATRKNSGKETYKAANLSLNNDKLQDDGIQRKKSLSDEAAERKRVDFDVSNPRRKSSVYMNSRKSPFKSVSAEKIDNNNSDKISIELSRDSTGSITSPKLKAIKEIVSSHTNGMKLLTGNVNNLELIELAIENVITDKKNKIPIENDTVLDTASIPNQSDVKNVIPDSPQVRALLKTCGNYNFEIFEFDQLTEHRPLITMSHHLIKSSGLLDRLSLPSDKFINFMFDVESKYDPNLACKPYLM